VRIAFFAWEYPPIPSRSLGAYAQEVTERFVRMGHDVTVFSLNPGNLPTREVVKGVEVHRPLLLDASSLPPLFSGNGWHNGLDAGLFNTVFLYNLLSASKLVGRLARKDRIRYDIVSFHDWLNSMAGLLAKDALGVAAVFHAHSCNNGQEMPELVAHAVERARTESDGIITVSNPMREHLIERGVPQGKIRVAWNGVDPKSFDPTRFSQEEVLSLRASYDVAEHEKLILFSGPLTAPRGASNLLRALPEVLKSHPETRLLVMGTGEEEKGLFNLASSLGIGDRIRWRTEDLPPEARVLHYAAADLCVFPSVQEPFGMEGLEAMAMEKPLVVGARGVVGLRDQVIPSGPDRNGVHVNGYDPGDIAWGIGEVLSNERRARIWGRNGRRRVLKHFTWQRVADQTIRCYESILDASGASGTHS